YTYKPNSKTIPDPVPALAHFDDGSYGITRDKLCRSGKITGLGFDKDDSERALNGIKIDTKLFKETDRWKSFFSSFIIRDGADSYDVLSLDTKDGAKLSARRTEPWSDICRDRFRMGCLFICGLKIRNSR